MLKYNNKMMIPSENEYYLGSFIKFIFSKSIAGFNLLKDCSIKWIKNKDLLASVLSFEFYPFLSPKQKN